MAWGGSHVWAVATPVFPTQSGAMWNSSERFHLDGCGSACSWLARGGCSSAASSAPGHVGLQPRAHEAAASSTTVAGSGTWGCSLWHKGLQPLAQGVEGELSTERCEQRRAQQGELRPRCQKRARGRRLSALSARTRARSRRPGAKLQRCPPARSRRARRGGAAPRRICRPRRRAPRRIPRQSRAEQRGRCSVTETVPAAALCGAPRAGRRAPERQGHCRPPQRATVDVPTAPRRIRTHAAIRAGRTDALLLVLLLVGVGVRPRGERPQHRG